MIRPPPRRSRSPAIRSMTPTPSSNTWTPKTGSITLTEFQAISTEGITKKEKVQDAAARGRTFKEYAGQDGTMNMEQFMKCYTELSQK